MRHASPLSSEPAADRFARALEAFLGEHDRVITWRPFGGSSSPLRPRVVFLGRGDNALEVALATSTVRPKADDVRRLWHQRQAGRPCPVLLVVAYPQADSVRATICGPVGSAPTIEAGLELDPVERLAAAALGEPTRHAAVRFLITMLDGLRAELIPGLRNAGLLATQELKAGVPLRPGWGAANAQGGTLLGLRGRHLLQGLGFAIEELSTTGTVLTVAGERRAVALLLEESEVFDSSGGRFRASPVEHALALADEAGVPWVILHRGQTLRLYAARPDTGVGRKGRAETYVEVNLRLLPASAAGYLPLLFGAGALVADGTIEDVLRRSAEFAAELGTRLRERLYDAVPGLATAVARRLGDPSRLTEADLTAAYSQALTLLFRLLFVAYGEDRDLLPFRSNADYAESALKTRAKQLVGKAPGEFTSGSFEIWDRLSAIFEAIDKGHPAWGIPQYNGGMFSSDVAISPAGAALHRMRLTDAEVGPALRALLVDTGTDGIVGPVDFRSLSVREFGSIYEGLLESRLSIAPTALTLDAKNSYIPAKNPAGAAVASGAVYFHNKSGARKASGSYFTKPFAVEHLLDHALEPALADHLQAVGRLLDEGRDAAAAEKFLDFRCADIAMGSGHFLVAAVDRIEARLSAFLALRPIRSVENELDTLRQTALAALGPLADGVEIKRASVLRRLVARRCVYGVDLKPMAVELARLSLWIHTFVPGLPLSFLSPNLISGNSLTGIGTLDELTDVLDPGHPSLFRDHLDTLLVRAADPLRRLGTLRDATVAEVEESRAAWGDVVAAVQPARRLADLAVAVRLGEGALPVDIDETTLARHPRLAAAEATARRLQALHFPTAFPEVFLRERSGFDCILGNPPWEKVRIEEHGFWATHFPGLRGMKQGDMQGAIGKHRRERPDLVADYDKQVSTLDAYRKVLLKGPYPGMGSGDPDLYKAFCWRFWILTREGGAIGVVLPRSALAASGSTRWREAILEGGAFSDVTMLLNSSSWVFDDVHAQFTIGLVSVRKGEAPAGSVSLSGPYSSRSAFESGRRQTPTSLSAAQLREWSTGAAFPLLPTERSSEVFLKLRAHPRFDAPGSWRFRPVREFDAALDKEHFEFDSRSAGGRWPVYKGASFKLWEPQTGIVYGWAIPKTVVSVLQRKRLKQQQHAQSAFAELSRSAVAEHTSLPCRGPRISVRDIARSTDAGTLVCALVPPNIVLVHTAPYLLRVRGDERDEAFILGVLGSVPLDWYARRYVELHVTFDLLNGFPIPRPARDDPIRRRVEITSGRLAAVDHRYACWAEAVGVPVGSVTEAEKPELIAELDAAVAVLYGLDAKDVRHIFETFHVGWDYTHRLGRVLHYFDHLKRQDPQREAVAS